MTITGRSTFLTALLVLLAACGGGGGGDRAPGVEPGPPAPGGAVPAPPPDVPGTSEAPYAEAESLFPVITETRFPGDGRPVVEFQLSDGRNRAITDLEAGDVRFIIAKLAPSPLGNLTGDWQSYVNRIEQPGVGPGSRPRLQATTESDGEFTNNGDGTYRYRFATTVNALPPAVMEQAATEGLDLSYDPGLTHRVAIQFANGQEPANPVHDVVPATGVTDGIFRREVASLASCNRCHDQLALHGGGRVELDYCVTCHNPGSGDANSGNTVDMTAMIHKIHRGVNLPSVQTGNDYAIYGFRDTRHDYSNLHYPQDIRLCTNCHAGTATGGDRDPLFLTAQGDNWSQVASRASCGSCHDTLDFSQHAGGQSDDSACASCHGRGGPAGTIADSHRIPVREARQQFQASVLGVDNSGPGQQARVSFRVDNPLSGEGYDLFNDPIWRESGSSINVRVAWDTRDYTNTGNGSPGASSIATSALSGAVPNGDGSYSVTLERPIPDSSVPPGIPASGSGVAIVEGRAALDLDSGGSLTSVPLGDAHAFFSINEPDGRPVPRRQSVAVQKCQACHGSLVFHGANRADNIDSCVSCHNPRNTDRGVREIAATPPTDGKREESLDFKSLIHAIHAAGFRDDPLQVVGFRGFTTYVYDEEAVHYPGHLDNCLACHTAEGYLLPLDGNVLATTVDTGTDREDPRDDTVATPASAACGACHDDPVARAHMRSNGGSFSTSQQAVDAGKVVEQCAVCHGEGRSQDAARVHDVRALPGF